MRHSSTLGKLYDAPLLRDEDEEERQEREQALSKQSWLREAPALLATRIPNSVFALGDLAGEKS